MNVEKTVEDIRKKYRADSAYDEWLEEHLDDFNSDEEEISFANFRLGNGKRVRNAENVEEVENAWKEYSEHKDGGPGSGKYIHKKKGTTLPKDFGVSKTRTANKNYNLTGGYDNLRVLKEQVANKTK